MRHILLTGAGGFAGSHILEHLLLNTDAHLTVTDSFRHHGATDRLTQVFEAHPEQRERVHVVTHDLTTPWSLYSVAEILSRGRVDTILSVAAESHVDRSIATPVPFIRNNVDVALSMLELARNILPDAFVHLSTDEVFGPLPFGRPSREWDPAVPSSPYSASKAAQDACCISYWRTYGVPLILLGCMNLIGERQDPEKFVPNTIRKVLRRETVAIHASATIPSVIGRRTYLHARNLADAMLFILTHERPVSATEGAFPLRYNVTGNCEVDNLTLAQRIAEYVGKPLNYELVDVATVRPGHDIAYGLDGTKLTEIGWRPPVEFWSSLQRTVEWTLARPHWLGI